VLDPIVEKHADAGARNLTIARDLLVHTPNGLNDPPFEWVVILAFYSAVRYVNAYLYSKNRTPPGSHSERERQIYYDSYLNSIFSDYTTLRDWSENARYALSHASFDGYKAQTAVGYAEDIQKLVKRLLAIP
jgi:hypothetical protein